MKFPRNARIFRGQFDFAPFASVFFVILIFVLLSSLVYTPGIRVPLQLPRADGLIGTDGPAITVAVDADGQFYFENQLIRETDLLFRMQSVIKASPVPVTLVVQGDRAMKNETLVRLTVLAQKAGITNSLLAILPGPFEPGSP